MDRIKVKIRFKKTRFTEVLDMDVYLDAHVHQMWREDKPTMTAIRKMFEVIDWGDDSSVIHKNLKKLDTN